ncbi:hypothetical protein KC19_5G023000 [Ceratodon purpureus]|uniref:Uncharacterized protein n=1 Tax=Ceratodon purpureus TaxID=3225 RepID=A0A8T0HYD7_CERPU|nr:hypothetical protein KC19_5G023000 [Ceratodon purpureus]
MYGHISHGSLCSPTATAQLDKTLLEHMAAGGNGSEALIQHDELLAAAKQAGAGSCCDHGTSFLSRSGLRS